MIQIRSKEAFEVKVSLWSSVCFFFQWCGAIQRMRCVHRDVSDKRDHA